MFNFMFLYKELCKGLCSHPLWLRKNPKRSGSARLAVQTALLVPLLSLPGLLHASPVNPLVVNMHSRYSVDVQGKFHLFADTVDSQLVWYVPKVGGIRNLNGAPSLSVNSSVIPVSYTHLTLPTKRIV